MSDVPESIEADLPADEGLRAVLSSISGLDDLPVAEHASVFEQAHEELRRALARPTPESS